MSEKIFLHGKYGCVYYPSYDCKLKLDKKSDFVSKLTKDNFISKNEINIGKKIIKIDPNENNFVVIRKNCSVVNNSKLKKDEDLQKCPILKKSSHKYLLLFSKYVKSISAYNLFFENEQKTMDVNSLLAIYSFLADCIKKLHTCQIVHNDLHFDNIIYDLVNKKYKILDFGLSVDILKCNTDYNYLKKIYGFFIPSFKYWSLEQHFISFLVSKPDNYKINKKDIDFVINSCLNEHKIFLKLEDTYLDVYKKHSTDFFMEYIGISKKKIIEDLLTFWKTWDLYRVSLHLLKIIIESNIYFEGLKQKLISFIEPNPNNRETLNIDFQDYKKDISKKSKKKMDDSLLGLDESIKKSFVESIKNKRVTSFF